MIVIRPRLPRGAVPTPKHEIEAARAHAPYPNVVVPDSFLAWPKQLSMWGNARYGDCVTAEEAFAKSVAAPQVFVPRLNAINWARSHGYLNGATLTQVMTTMQTKGFVVGGATYNDGAHSKVDWKTPATLQSAIFSTGPVKLGVAGDSFETNPNFTVNPQGFPQTGWCIFDYPAGGAEDHCVSLCGSGATLAELVALFAAQGVTVAPSGGQPAGVSYALFTWDSIGIVDEQSMLNMTAEAWVRNPVTIA